MNLVQLAELPDVRLVITLVDIDGIRHELPIPEPARMGTVMWSAMPELPLARVELEARFAGEGLVGEDS